MLVIGGGVVPVNAEFFLKDYHAIKEDDFFKIYIRGVAEGYGWANASLKISGNQDKLFCLPGKMRMTTENYTTILDDYISKHDPKAIYGENFPVEPILLRALQEVFPCQ